MPEPGGPIPAVPEARSRARSRTRLSLVWLVPIVAALVGVWVAVAKIMSEGPKITIVFDSAEGLEAGKTKLRYNGVDVGTVTSVALTDDHRRVIAAVDMAPKTEDFLVEDTTFWVVRPRISGANVSGLGTLISGAYIALEIGKAPRKRRDFVALTAPPVVKGDTPGRFYVLKTAELGSVDYGTPIYFRHLRVGEVVSYALDAGGAAFTLKAFVNAPYDQYVTGSTRFWHASGVDVSLTASGLSVQTESVLSILIGGIAFETPATGPVLPAADADTAFTLFGSRADAYKPAARDPQHYGIVFRQTVRGLTVGAPVEFRGIPIGEVIDLAPQFDAGTDDFSVHVNISVDPRMFGVKVIEGPVDESARRKMVDTLVARGLRAQLRSGSLLTGALFVALDFFPDAEPAPVDWSQDPPRIAVVPGALEGVEANVASIVKKLDAMPLQAIGEDLRKALVDLDRTLVSARGTLDDAGKLVAPNSPLGDQLNGTLDDVGRAARGLRGLADYLEQHPESLIRGKPGEAK